MPVLVLVALLSALPAFADDDTDLPRIPYPTESLKTYPLQTRGDSELDKLDAQLRKLYEQYTGDRRNPSEYVYSREQLTYLFGIDASDPNPLVRVAVALADGADAAELADAGVTVLSVNDDLALVSVPVVGLQRLARHDSVVTIEAVQVMRNPTPPARVKMSLADKVLGMRDAEGRFNGQGPAFDDQGLTGRGVIVGVVDSGIEWSHGDFVDPNGASRILYLWDMMDGSYGESGGTIGAQAPVGIAYAGEDKTYYYGTLYTRDMLTAALRGEGTCNSVDRVGHGTACASVAAGNGLATAYSVPAGTYAGVAPEADLMVCRAGDGAFDGDYIKAVEWIADTAASLGRPCVINLSLGGHASAHDGMSAEEQFLNRIAARPGVAICVSAGNEGRQSFHTSGRFGPRDSGYADVESDPVELFVTNTTELHAYYGMNDDWGFALVGLDNFLTDDQGNPGVVYVSCQSDRYSVSVSDNINGLDLSNWQAAITFRDASADREIVSFPVPPGRYLVCAYGTTANVSDGSFDFYLPMYTDASFGRGAVQTRMVCSPGNADGVITAGSYDFRDQWLNWSDASTRYNLELGGVSDYSSPGYRVDGVIKPDLVAPGRFAISAKAVGSAMAESGGSEHTTSDGLHLAWEGTSAAAPYVAGVVALMFEKNPNLSTEQVKEILIRTAVSDRQTGGVPNELWGHGKIDPAAALRATPAP